MYRCVICWFSCLVDTVWLLLFTTVDACRYYLMWFGIDHSFMPIVIVSLPTIQFHNYIMTKLELS